MPLLNKKIFEPKQFISEQMTNDVFYFKLTNEIFESHDEYFDRVILCNSLVWGCTVTGKSGLTFQEAIDSEKSAAKSLETISRELRKAIFYLVNLTRRGKVADVCDDIFSYTREHYFRGEVVKGVIGNMWCHSTILHVIPPTDYDIEDYKKDLIERGEFEKNDYLKDDSWGPPPDLFKYEVCETEPDNPDTENLFVLESVDVKRDKAVVTRDKCRYLVKLNTYFDEEAGYWKLKESVLKHYDLSRLTFESIFVGDPPAFQETILKPQVKPPKKVSTSKTMSNHNTSNHTTPTNSKKRKSNADCSSADGKNKAKKIKTDQNEKQIKKISNSKSPKVEVAIVQLSPSELKQIELVKRHQERERQKENRKLIADFKKLWFKTKEDLMVEDLKDLPEPEPINCKIPNHLFGDFMMILEYCHCYSSVLKVRDYFPNGLTFETLEKILFSNEIAGPFNELLQLLLKTIFRLQVDEEYDKMIELNPNNEFGVDTNVELNLPSILKQNNNVYNWSKVHQNTQLNRLYLDHLTLNEILRLHLLSSGANSSSEESKWRYQYQQRGGYNSTDDPGLELILNTDIINTLNHGSVFELHISDRIKLITCLINQIFTYSSIREMMDESLESFKKARFASKNLQASEKRAEFEDNLWKQRIRSEKAIPDLSVPKPKPTSEDADPTGIAKPVKPELTEQQIEFEISKRDKESEKRKALFQNNFFELANNINKYEKKLGLHPIGRDRSFRRYWIFSTFPALFVENDDQHIGECIGPTPFIGDVDVNDINFVKAHFEKLKQDDENLQQNKENSTLKISKVKPGQPQPIQVCNGNTKTCRIHSKINQVAPKWTFYSNEQQITELVNNLTSRGRREKELKTWLTEEKEGLIQLLTKCPKYKLNFKYPSEPSLVSERKSGRIKNALDPNLNFPTGTSINKIFELQIRDIILETEDKIFLGGLGSLKVSDRFQWRSVLENRKYDPLVDSLNWGISNSLLTEDLPPPLALRSFDSDYRHIVKDMACAILQLKQSMEPKFFKKPLGDKEDADKKPKQKKTSLELQNENPNRPIGQTQLEKWEISLMKCVNFSQLFVHLFTLDNSIEWTRSVLNARCRVCRRKGDGENMLLCDHCNKGHHLYCLKPQLEVIPKGDWFCVDCRPVEVLPPRNKVQKKYFDKGDDEDGDLSEEEENQGEEEMEDESNIIEVCEVCKTGGEVICCDGCPRVYHLYCLVPPKTRVPRGEWLCEICTNSKKKQKKKKAAKKRTSRQISNSSSNSTSVTPSETSEEEEELEATTDETDDESEKGNSQSASASRDSDENSNGEEEEPRQKSFVKVKFNSKRTGSVGQSKKTESEESSSSNSSRSNRNSRESGNDSKETQHRNQRHSLNARKKTKLLTTSSDGEDQKSSTSTTSSEDEGRYLNSRSSGSTVKRNTRLQRNFFGKIQQTNELDNIALDKLLHDIMKHKDAWPFLKPVTKMDAQDYHDIVVNPMDLGTVKYKLNSMVYTCNTEFIGDLHLVFDNCFLYNPPDNQIFKAGEDLQIFCERRCSQLGITY